MSLFAQAFGGTWTCHDPGAQTAWQISAAPGGNWAVVRWGDQQSANGGRAYVGYVAAQKHWIYEDFHYDGSYAQNASSGPNGQTWTWDGKYFLGGRVLSGRVVWSRVAANRINRYFERYARGRFEVTGQDHCTKA